MAREQRGGVMLKVYGASYFFEDDPETPIVALWVRRDPEKEIREVRMPYVYLGLGRTTWTSLYDDMPRPLVDREDWQYDRYRDKDPFFHMESSEPLSIPEPEDFTF
jgi:hypothetical protein